MGVGVVRSHLHGIDFGQQSLVLFAHAAEEGLHALPHPLPAVQDVVVPGDSDCHGDGGGDVALDVGDGGEVVLEGVDLLRESWVGRGVPWVRVNTS